MVEGIIAAVCTIITFALPVIVEIMKGKRDAKQALAQRDIDELRRGLDKLPRS